MCTEAGLLALRERRMRVSMEDMRKAKENVLYRKKDNAPETMYLWLELTISLLLLFYLFDFDFHVRHPPLYLVK